VLVVVFLVFKKKPPTGVLLSTISAGTTVGMCNVDATLSLVAQNIIKFRRELFLLVRRVFICGHSNAGQDEEIGGVEITSSQ